MCKSYVIKCENELIHIPVLLNLQVNSVFLVLTVCNLLHSKKYGGAEIAISTFQLVR